MPDAVTIDRAELDRRLAAAFEKDEWLASLGKTLAGRATLRQQRIESFKVEIVQFQTERSRELGEAHKHRNLARLIKGKINTTVKRINQTQKTDKTEKATRKKIIQRQRTIRQLVKARLQIEVSKHLRRTLKL